MKRAAAACAVVVCALAPAGRALAGGSFETSDPLLNRIWLASVKTANDGVQKPIVLDPRGCQIYLLAGHPRRAGSRPVSRTSATRPSRA